MTTFPSKIDFKIVAFPVLVIGFTTFMMIKDGIWVGVLVNVLTLALVLYIFYSIRYTIDGQFLHMKVGFYKYPPIDIHKIRYIDLTNSWHSSPAASLDRMNLQCGKMGTFTVSPADKETFVQMLLAVNPDIVVKPSKHA
jgi:hypothetical protein